MPSTTTVQSFMRARIQAGQDEGKVRRAEIYTTTLNSFNRFLEGKDFSFREMTPALMARYEQWLSRNHVRRNTSSFYLRILRAVYNQAVDLGLTRQQFPFKHVYTGHAKTNKRALNLDEIKRMRCLDLSNAGERFARDMFLFSFYTRGMAFVDMAYLKKQDLHDGILTYKRHKTGQKLSIRWEPVMQEIVNRYTSKTQYMLPIIHTQDSTERNQYRNIQNRVNKLLKTIAAKTGITQSLSTF